jgi:hypothetical protein
VTRLYEDEAELYDIAFDWDISDQADWLVARLEARGVPVREIATYDGGTKGKWPRVDARATGGLLWHELTL